MSNHVYALDVELSFTHRNLPVNMWYSLYRWEDCGQRCPETWKSHLAKRQIWNLNAGMFVLLLYLCYTGVHVYGDFTLMSKILDFFFFFLWRVELFCGVFPIKDNLLQISLFLQVLENDIKDNIFCFWSFSSRSLGLQPEWGRVLHCPQITEGVL